MDKNQIVTFLKSNHEYLAIQFDVKSIALFGSYARNQHTDASDVDLLVEFNNPTFNSWIGLLSFLETNLHKKIQLVTTHSTLKGNFYHTIKPDLIYA